MKTKLELTTLVLILCTSLLFAQVPSGWEKISGGSNVYSGIPDGIMGDRQNSYASAMAIFGNNLYVGTSRDTFGYMLAQAGTFVHMPQIPIPTDMRARIYKMGLQSMNWSPVYISPAGSSGLPMMGHDIGYSVMRTFRDTLYVGSSGVNEASLLAISPGGTVQRIFRTTAANPGDTLSIRAITQHMGRLFWASEDSRGPVIWYSDNPLADYQANHSATYNRIRVPRAWFYPTGAQIVDMISYNDALYVFFLPYDEATGFWAAKLTFAFDTYSWNVIVGNSAFGAAYPPGMGRTKNGAVVSIYFKGNVYVGTSDGAALRMMSGNSTPIDVGLVMGGLGGAQIFRFDTNDEWTRVMPSELITHASASEAASGFHNSLNKYIWHFGISDGRLYAGTFDLGTGVTLMYLVMPSLPFSSALHPLGFDLYSTLDGETWISESVNGFGDPWNYGVPTLVTDRHNGNLYMGTANPFYGAQVWKMLGSGRIQQGLDPQEIHPDPQPQPPCTTNTSIASSNQFPSPGDLVTFTVSVTSDCAAPVNGPAVIYMTSGGVQQIASGQVINGKASLTVALNPPPNETRAYFYAVFTGTTKFRQSMSGNHVVAWFQ